MTSRLKLACSGDGGAAVPTYASSTTPCTPTGRALRVGSVESATRTSWRSAPSLTSASCGAIAGGGYGERVVSFLGRVYDQTALTMLRQHCHAYVHGHSAGGTNPSLLEAMAARALIIAHDNPCNREVCGSNALFFTDAATLCRQLRAVDNDDVPRSTSLRDGALDRVQRTYTWASVLHDYETVIGGLAKERTHEAPAR